MDQLYQGISTEWSSPEVAQAELEETISNRISAAEKNALSLEEIGAFEERLGKITDESIDRGHAIAEGATEEDTILAELMHSSAMAYNIAEFKELLIQVEQKFKLEEGWAKDLLAHENTHANVLETQETIWWGYGILFMKDGAGNLTNLQPLNFSRSPYSWSPKQVVLRSLEGMRAPSLYGDKTSEGDDQQITKELERLAKIEAKETLDREKASQVKVELQKL